MTPADETLRALYQAFAAGDGDRLGQLLGDTDLPIAVLACKGLARAELARLRDARHHPFGVAGTDPIQRFAGDDVEIPGLGVH